MSRHALLNLLLIAAIVVYFAVGVGADGKPARSPGTWKILYTGDTRGYLKPCGCSKGLLGGLPRRATVLKSERRSGDLLLDLGNIIVGSRPHERLKLEYVIEGQQTYSRPERVSA